jgi:hypothetical protein
MVLPKFCLGIVYKKVLNIFPSSLIIPWTKKVGLKTRETFSHLLKSHTQEEASSNLADRVKMPSGQCVVSREEITPDQ